jgi:cytoskeletal protein CcmA (bactofilin family)
VIGNDLVVKGEIRSLGRVEVHGFVEGKVSCDHLLIHPGGRVLGTIETGNADINGTMQGRARVRNTIAIGSTGKVSGDVRYGNITLSDGGELLGDLRNIPPELEGDFQIVVRKGRSVALTTADITAFDPDNAASELNFRVASPSQGHIARAASPAVAIDSFTQAELEAGGILFVHDGASGGDGSFDVRVFDGSGADSGAARTVTVAVV